MAKSVNEMPKASDAIPEMPAATPFTSVEMIDGTDEEASCIRAGGAGRVDADVLHPALDLVGGATGRGRDLAALANDPAQHEEEDHHSDRRQGEQNDQGTECPRRTVPLQPGHARRGDDRNDSSRDHRHDDRRRDAEHPGQPEEERADADEEPGRETEVAQPPRRREHGGQLLELVGVELHDDLLDRPRDVGGRCRFAMLPEPEIHRWCASAVVRMVLPGFTGEAPISCPGASPAEAAGQPSSAGWSDRRQPESSALTAAAPTIGPSGIGRATGCRMNGRV